MGGLLTASPPHIALLYPIFSPTLAYRAILDCMGLITSQGNTFSAGSIFLQTEGEVQVVKIVLSETV